MIFIESCALGILSLLGGSAFGVSALGVALIFQIGYFLLGSSYLPIFDEQTLTQANVYLTIALLPMAFVESFHLRHKINFQYSIYFGGTTAVLTVIGIILLSHFNENVWFTRSLGIFLLLSFFTHVCIRYFKHLQKPNRIHLESDRLSSNDSRNDIVIGNDNRRITIAIDANLIGLEMSLTHKTSNEWSSNHSFPSHSLENSDSHSLSVNNQQQNGNVSKLQSSNISWKVDSCSKRLLLIFLGICSGLLRGMWGVAGVPLMFFALLSNINMDEFRSSTALAMVFSETVSIVQLLIIEQNFQTRQWIQYLSIIVCGFVGLLIGNYISPHMNQQKFHHFIQYLIFCGGVVLTSRGLYQEWMDFAVSLTLIVCGCLLCMRCLLCRRGYCVSRIYANENGWKQHSSSSEISSFRRKLAIMNTYQNSNGICVCCCCNKKGKQMEKYRKIIHHGKQEQCREMTYQTTL